MGIRVTTPGMEHLFRALADHTRLRLLNLMEGREICVCYLVNVTGESQPKISRHLAYMRHAGIVAAKREGKWMHYRIEAPKDIAGRRVLDAVFACLRQDKAMQADRARLTRACCKPEKYVAAQGAPVPTALSLSTRKECH
ncbi:MAG: ArsR/SmtB family transcription factor [Acidobacteriaceae bacterium]